MPKISPKIEIRGDLLKHLISDRALSLSEIGSSMGVSRQTLYNWISDNSLPEERLIEFKKLLNLDHDEFAHLLLRPLTILFRTHRNIDVSQDVKLGIEQVAREFIQLDTSKIARKQISSQIICDDPKDMAESIVRQLGLTTKRLSLENAILSLEAQNIHVVFYDFGTSFVGREAQAACVNTGKISLIFVNANEALEDVTWRIFHEVCHLFAGHATHTIEQEKFCNAVATEIVTPSVFFQTNRDLLVIELKEYHKAPIVIMELARLLSAGFFGVVLALKSNRIIDQNTFLYLCKYFKKRRIARPTVLQKIIPSSEDSIDFWNVALTEPDQRKFLKFQFMVQNALIEDRFEISRASEIFGLNLRSMKKLISQWQDEFHPVRFDVKQKLPQENF